MKVGDGCMEVHYLTYMQGCFCCFSVTQLCLTLCIPIDCSMLGLPVHHQFLEFTQIPVH